MHDVTENLDRKTSSTLNGSTLLIRPASAHDIKDIELMVADFVKGHPAENHPRSSDSLRTAYFGGRPVAHLLVAERDGEIFGMIQWRLIHDMFWGMFGADAEWLYVKPARRGTGIAAALVARACADASKAGAEFLHGGGGDGPSKLYERVAIGYDSRECHVSGKAFQAFARLDGLPTREIVRRLPDKQLGLQPADK
jgi:GNAT superfamily N-acetyltransferase